MRARRGGALLVAVALLSLAGALLAGAMASAHAAARAAKSYEAAFIADAESRVVIAATVAAWSAADDSVPIGSSRIVSIGPRHAGSAGAIVLTRVRVQRLTADRYVIATDCQVGPDSAVQARRRMHLVLERAARADTTLPVAAPSPINRWSMSDLFL